MTASLTQGAERMARRAPLPMLLVEEVAEHLRVEPFEVRDWIRCGALCAIVLPGEVVRIAPEHLSRFLRTRLTPFSTTLLNEESIADDM